VRLAIDPRQRPGFDDAVRIAASRVLERTAELAGVVSPTGDEGPAREVVAHWWREDGLSDVSADEAGNLWATSGPAGPASLALAAHLDTVFGADVAHKAQRRGNRLVGPGVGDDRAALAALSEVASLVTSVDPRRPLVLLATVGEEGLGNLRGATVALEEPRHHFGALIALEGNYLDRVVNVAVGSVRTRVRFEGPGGHAWEAAGQPSAVHAAAEAVAGVARLEVVAGRDTVNVGTLRGGESINSLARVAEFELDVRSSDPASLAELVARAEAICASAAEGLRVTTTEIGRRPAGRLDPAHPLVRAAWEALEAVGRTPHLSASSTDANAAHPRGVPAIALGVTRGEGEHTPDEWIDVDLIEAGLRALVLTVLEYEGVHP
jgi:tripeptide aminopeptidase